MYGSCIYSDARDVKVNVMIMRENCAATALLSVGKRADLLPLLMQSAGHIQNALRCSNHNLAERTGKKGWGERWNEEREGERGRQRERESVEGGGGGGGGRGKERKERERERRGWGGGGGGTKPRRKKERTKGVSLAVFGHR